MYFSGGYFYSFFQDKFNVNGYFRSLCSVLTAGKKRAFQVKKTKVTKSIAKRIVKNWILVDKNNTDVEQFVLVTDREVSKDIFNCLDINEIFEEINAADGKKSLDVKVKSIGYTKSELEQKVQNIVSKIIIRKYENIDVEIEDKFKDFFIRYGVNEVTYYIRIKEFLQQITVDILDAVEKGQPFRLTYESVSQIKNRIVTSYTDEKWSPASHNLED